MPLYDRDYYLKHWNFDPLRERKDLDETGKKYAYEKKYPIKNDRFFSEMDLFIGARVIVEFCEKNEGNNSSKERNKNGKKQTTQTTNRKKHNIYYTEGNEKLKIDNYIVWFFEEQEYSIPCIHTVIFEGSVKDVEKIGIDEIKKKLPSKRQILVEIKPEEHFIALKAFVKGLIKSSFDLHFQKLLQKKENTYPLRIKLLHGLYTLIPQIFLKKLKDMGANTIQIKEIEDVFQNLEKK